MPDFCGVIAMVASGDEELNGEVQTGWLVDQTLFREAQGLC
jgi:hypothetical protein